MNPSDLREYAIRWKESFGGGMIPFDTAYWRVRADDDKSIADAQLEGGHALLDAFVEAVIQQEATDAQRTN